MIQVERPIVNRQEVLNYLPFVDRAILQVWLGRLAFTPELEHTQQTLDKMRHDATTRNIIVFFDHHYAFDAFPAAFELAGHLQNIHTVHMPYAVHLDMHRNKRGWLTPKYVFRSWAFKRLKNQVAESELNIVMKPVKRQFESDQPTLSRVADTIAPGCNLAYIKHLLAKFPEPQTGQMLLLAPMGGIAFPGKDLLDPTIYNILQKVQKKAGVSYPVYTIGGYPAHYRWPLITPHGFYATGPIEFETDTPHQLALSMVTQEINALRQIAGFTQPSDYSRLASK